MKLSCVSVSVPNAFSSIGVAAQTSKSKLATQFSV
jgi:hypothetical protein